MMEPEEIDKIVERHLVALQEFFPICRIFVQQYDPADGCTGTWSSGRGNYYAQLGQVRTWLIEQEHRARVAVERRDAQEDEDQTV